MAVKPKDVAELLAHINPDINVDDENSHDFKVLNAALKMARGYILTITQGQWDVSTDEDISVCDFVQTMATYRFYLNPEYESSNQLIELRTLNNVASNILVPTPDEKKLLEQKFFKNGKSSLQSVSFSNADYRFKIGGDNFV